MRVLFFLIIALLLDACKTNLNLPEPDKRFIEEDFPKYYKIPVSLITDTEIKSFEDSIEGKLILWESRENLIRDDSIYGTNRIRFYNDCFDHAYLYEVYDEKNNIRIFHYYNFSDTIGSKADDIHFFTVFEDKKPYNYPNPEIVYSSKVKYIVNKWQEEVGQNYKYKEIIPHNEILLGKQLLSPYLSNLSWYRFADSPFKEFTDYLNCKTQIAIVIQNYDFSDVLIDKEIPVPKTGDCAGFVISSKNCLTADPLKVWK